MACSLLYSRMQFSELFQLELFTVQAQGELFQLLFSLMRLALPALQQHSAELSQVALLGLESWSPR